jgi:protease IV
MKQFFSFMFASMLGFLLSSVLLFFILFGLLVSVASLTSKETVEVKNKSVLHLEFSAEVVDRGGRGPFDDFDFMSFSSSSAIGLNDLINNLEKAAKDENIEGIFLDLSFVRTGWASVGEIREAMLGFKESGKFIIAYGETFSQNAYYLASIADEIYLHPEGMIDFRGINAEMFFLKNMLGKLGIDAQIIRHGEFKSAGEMFSHESMSEANREQTLAYTSSIWNNITAAIARSRGLSVNHLNEVADAFNTRNASLSLENDMIDGVMYRDEILAHLNRKLEQDEDSKINLISLGKYDSAPLPEEMVKPRSPNKIAVIYAAGSILPGEGGELSIGTGIARAIREARLDESVKAIVFRINSGGGSALVSDVILREAKLAADAKPVVASMGNVAASGGYYIACAADKIIASPTTITGSIGVFGMIPNMENFFNQKLGITFDNVKTNELADLGSLSRPLTARERDIIQASIGEVYETFINHVAEGRDMPVSTIDELGRGRVWSGSEALQNGLIDEYGGLSHAIEVAAELAELDDYRIMELPTRKEFFEKLMEDFGGVQERMIQKRLGAAYHYYKQVEEYNQMTGILAKMPYDFFIE